MNIFNRTCARSNTSARKEGLAQSHSASRDPRQNNAVGATLRDRHRMPGKMEDSIFEAVQIDVEGLKHHSS
jgi:hypothetical protein